MIDKLAPTTTHTNHIAPQKVMKMVKNERMGGYVPKWENASTPQEIVQQNLSAAQNKKDPSISQYGNAYQESAASDSAATDEFTFADLIDMVNPLHHIPGVNYVYRNITGDEIKPIGNIVGGAVFGGPVGVASGLINTIIQEETGKDVAQNAIGAMRGEAPDFAYKTKNNANPYDKETTPLNAPEENLNNAIEIAQEYDDMASALLAFSDSGARTQNQITIERAPVASGRTAGKTTSQQYPSALQSEALLREPITQVSLSAPQRLYDGEN